jgi:flagellar biosynthesis protein FliR
VPDLLTSLPSWAIFFLIVCRLGTVVAIAPLFGERGTPPAVKVALTLVLSFAYLPLVRATALGHLGSPGTAPGWGGQPGWPGSSLPADAPSYLVLVGRELLVGGTMGLTVLLVFNALMAAGQIVGLQIGFSMGSILNPLHSEPVGPIDHFYGLLATAIFFAIDGQQLVLLAVQRSFALVPLGTVQGTPALCLPGQPCWPGNPLSAGPDLLTWGGELFLIGAQLAFPVAGALFLADVALALLSRALPQLNVFILGAPVKIVVGLTMLAATIPVTLLVMSHTFGNLATTTLRLLVQGSPGPG